MGVAISFLLSVAALALFALATARHYRQAFGRSPSARAARVLRGVGALLLICAPAPWMAQRGPAMALVTWLFCALPLAGLTVVALVTALGARLSAPTPER